VETGAGSTLGIVAERGSVGEGVVLAARTIGAFCMRAESSMHFLSAEDTITCLLHYSDDLAVASRKAGTCEYAFVRQRKIATPLEIASLST
jgi:hypothetical protein